MLEYNGDTPSLAIETSDASEKWAKDRFGDKKTQSNYYRYLMERQFKNIIDSGCRKVGFAALAQDDENTAVMNFYRKAFKGVGGKVIYGDITDLKINQCKDGCTKASWNLAGKEVDCVLSLYPKEWLATEISKDDLLTLDLAQLRTVEPWWKLIMANKAMLPLLWKMYPNNKYLLPTYYSYEEASKELGFKNIVSKPLYGREGTGVNFGWEYTDEKDFKDQISNGQVLGRSIYQEYSKMPIV